GRQEDDAGDAAGGGGEGCVTWDGLTGGGEDEEKRLEEGGERVPGSGSNRKNTSEATIRALAEESQPAANRKSCKGMHTCMICDDQDHGRSEEPTSRTPCCFMVANKACFETRNTVRSTCFWGCSSEITTSPKDKGLPGKTVISKHTEAEDQPGPRSAVVEGIRFAKWYTERKQRCKQVRPQELVKEEYASVSCVLDVPAKEVKQEIAQETVARAAGDQEEAYIKAEVTVAGPLPFAFAHAAMAQQAALPAPCYHAGGTHDTAQRAATVSEQMASDEVLARKIQNQLQAEAAEAEAKDSIARTRPRRARSEGPGGRSGHAITGGGKEGNSHCAGIGRGGGAKDQGRIPWRGQPRSASASLPPVLTAGSPRGTANE
ncbi:unnamed protein product, partial [Ectocarpus fasciculatus]